MDFKLIIMLLITTVFSFKVKSQSNYNQSKPNIIFMMIDDWGFGDCGIRGSTEIPTPNFDDLANDGVFLENYYTHTLCTPSRAALLTGYYASTIGLQYVIKQPQRGALPLDVKTLPEYLREFGYTNRMVGKWNLGFQRTENTPLRRGFDSHFGFWGPNVDYFVHTGPITVPNSMVYNLPFYEQRKEIPFNGFDFRDDFKPVSGKQGEYLTDLLTESFTNIILNHDQKKPLFMYIAHHGVHRGSLVQPNIIAPPKYTAPFSYIHDKSRRNYAGALKAVDESIGEMVKSLEARNMLQNTIIIITGDNGAPRRGSFTFNGGSNYPLKGYKETIWEGGVRNNALIWSGGGLLKKTGYHWNGLAQVSDWLPTLYGIAGGNVAELGDIDGKDLWKAISENLISPRQEILHHYNPENDFGAFQMGDYKVVYGPTISNFTHLPEITSMDGRINKSISRPPYIPCGVSQVKQTLSLFYNDSKRMNAAVKISKLDCGLHRKENDCNSKLAPCLYNIKKDPCEFNNVAQSETMQLQMILERFAELKLKSKFPAPNTFDYDAIPTRHAGFWVSWLDEYYNRPTFCS